jgi:hypothetical protein
MKKRLLAPRWRLDPRAAYTDEDGFYQYPYKHKGKSTTYTIVLLVDTAKGIPEEMTEPATIKANKFAVVNFVIEYAGESLVVDEPSSELEDTASTDEDSNYEQSDNQGDKSATNQITGFNGEDMGIAPDLLEYATVKARGFEEVVFLIVPY